MAERKECTPAQLSLAWVMSKGNDIVPIPGTKQLRYIEENARASEIILNAEEQKQLETATGNVTVVGERYTTEGMKGVNA